MSKYSDFDTELEEVKRARANIDSLRKRRIEQPQGQMVSGHYVAPHWTQSILAPLADQLSTGVQEGMANTKEARLNQAMQAQQEKWMAARPQAKQFEVPGPVEEGQGPLMSSPVEPTQQERLAWAQQGQNNPLSRAIASKYGEDQLIQEPIREAARVEKRSDREDRQIEARNALAENMKLQREKLQERAEDAKRRSEDTRLSIEQRAEAARERAEILRAVHANKASQEPSHRAKERIKLEEQVNSVHAIDNIVLEARPLLKKATGSGVGAALDTAGGIFGIVVPGSEEAAQLKVVEGNLMKHQPKFKGTDSDRDTKLYQAAAAQIGDAKTPNAIRETAMKTVQRLARKDMEMTHRLAKNFNEGSGEHLPTIDIPDMPPPLPEEGTAATPAAPLSSALRTPIAPVAALPKSLASRQVSGKISGIPGSMPEDVNAAPTGVATAPAVTVQLPPADIERANILMSEYRKGPKAPMDAASAAALSARDKRDIAAELARMGIDAETGGPLQRRATDKAPTKKARTWNREKGAFDD